MKNLIKKGPEICRFKAGSFECGEEYTLEINGEKHNVGLSVYKSGGVEAARMPLHDVSFVCFHRTLIPGDPYPFINPVYPGQNICNGKHVPGVGINIDVPAERFANGEVKIYYQDKLINPDDVLKISDEYIVDTDKINMGSLWNLTIDGDPRFQNTLVLITHVYGSTIEFSYQTRVIYTSDYAHIECAEGRIDFTHRTDSDGKPINIMDYIDKIHFTLVKDNTNGGADMDRTNANLIYPRSYNGGYREIYPPIKFREHPPHSDVDDGDYDDNIY